MNLSKIKWEILEWLGYVFCEASIRWWYLFDDGSDLERRCCYPTRWEMVTYSIGVPSYRIGCFFYNLQDDEAAGIEAAEIEESNESH
ncbi:MAG: hypothetical protein H8E12_19650 [Rhodobacteraceae bacterium]|nr:hypothetical protein [Paracoccaceae bacterium]